MADCHADKLGFLVSFWILLMIKLVHDKKVLTFINRKIFSFDSLHTLLCYAIIIR